MTRNRLLLPHPFGPVTMTLTPGCTSKDRSETSSCPSGDTMSQCSNLMKSVNSTHPPATSARVPSAAVCAPPEGANLSLFMLKNLYTSKGGYQKLGWVGDRGGVGDQFFLMLCL